MRIVSILLLLLFLSPHCLGESSVMVLPPGDRNPALIEGPLTVWSEITDAPRPIVVHFLKLDLTNPKFEPFVCLSPDPDGPGGPAEGVLILPEDLMRDPAVLAMINANAFSRVPAFPHPQGTEDWFLGQMVDIEGLAVADGIERSPDQAGRMPFWLDKENKPHIGHPQSTDKVLHAVADWFSPLIIDGDVAVPSCVTEDGSPNTLDSQDLTIENSLHPRSVLGFHDQGEWLLLGVIDGRRDGYSLGMSLTESAELLKSKGCTHAINLDGGGSSIMMIRAENDELVTVNLPSSNSHRPIPIMFGVRLRGGV